MMTLAQSEAEGLRDTLHRQESLGAYWRRDAFKCFANYIFCEHLRPFQEWYSESALCDRMNRLKVPCYRGCAPWTPDKIAGIRRAVPRHIRDAVDKRARRTVS